MNLKDKKVLITGATGGIGYDLVKKFTDLGAVVLAVILGQVLILQPTIVLIQYHR